MLTDIATKKALDDDIKKRLTDAINDYKANFLADRKEARKRRLRLSKPWQTYSIYGAASAV